MIILPSLLYIVQSFPTVLDMKGSKVLPYVVWRPVYEPYVHHSMLLGVDGGPGYTEGSGEEGQPFHSPQLLGGWRWSWLVITG